MNLSELEKKSIQLRIDTVSTIHKAQSGHTGSALSCLDILISLYYGKIGNKPVLNFDSSKPGWDEQDYVFLSKGDAVPSLYAILADLKFFDKSELNNYCRVGNLLQGYATRRVPGVVYTAGPVADAFAIASGIAISLKMEKAANRVFTILSDAEMQDGSIWEAAMSAAHHACDNLIAFVDNSGLQVDGYIRGIMDVNPIQDKFESFGWKVFHVLDGHDHKEILEAISKAMKVKKQPVCIWAHTLSAKGIPFAEGKPIYYASPLSDAEMDELIPIWKKELEELTA